MLFRSNGLTGSEIQYLLQQSQIEDIDSQNAKWKRLYSAFANYQNTHQCSNKILYFNKSVDKYINLTNRLLRRFYRGFSNDLENVRNSLLCVIILSNNPCQKQR